ncbi:MAG: hypothetical protein K2X32_02210 [Phycisphaerales bacterium]|nr:hypothetical protein [Phycisphaerales bacterium]
MEEVLSLEVVPAPEPVLAVLPVDGALAGADVFDGAPSVDAGRWQPVIESANVAATHAASARAAR